MRKRRTKKYSAEMCYFPCPKRPEKIMCSQFLTAVTSDKKKQGLQSLRSRSFAAFHASFSLLYIFFKFRQTIWPIYAHMVTVYMSQLLSRSNCYSTINTKKNNLILTHVRTYNLAWRQTKCRRGGDATACLTDVCTYQYQLLMTDYTYVHEQQTSRTPRVKTVNSILCTSSVATCTCGGERNNSGSRVGYVHKLLWADKADCRINQTPVS